MSVDERSGVFHHLVSDVTQRYQSFREFHTNPSFSFMDGDNDPSTPEMVRHAHLILVSTTQTKLVGALLLGFSLLALLSGPPIDATDGEALAKLLLGVSTAITFATTTFAMLEAHYLHTLSAASERYLSLRGDKEHLLHGGGFDRDGSFSYDLEQSASGLGGGCGGGGGGGGLCGGGGCGQGGRNDSTGSSQLNGFDEEDDARLASRFKVLLADLETLRAWARGALWFSMLLLVFATLLRLGRGDLGFVLVGVILVACVGAVFFVPVLRRLREGYAPLIKEYRGLSKETQGRMSAQTGAAAVAAGVGDSDRFL